MELKDRIKYILNNNKVKPGISEYEFARSVKTYPAKFAEIRSGKVKTLSNDIALEISKQYGYEFKWIATGVGEMYANQRADDCIKIPVLGEIEASCGYGVVMYDETKTAEYSINSKLLNDLGASASRSEIIFARGDSMEPTIRGGDLLLVDRTRTEIYDGCIYCVRLDGQLYAKRLQKISSKKLKIICDNKDYEPIVIEFSNDPSFDFEIIGEILWISRVAK